MYSNLFSDLSGLSSCKIHEKWNNVFEKESICSFVCWNHIWPSLGGVPLIPGWIPSSRQCTSLRRLLLTLLFVIVILCLILFNRRRWVRKDHNGKHLPLNVRNPLTDFETLLQKRCIWPVLSFDANSLTRKWEMKMSKKMRNRDKNWQWLPFFDLYNSLTEFLHLLHVFMDPLVKHFGKTEYR